MNKLLSMLMVTLIVSGCETAMYNTLEKIGIHKRDILVDRIEDTQKAQQEAQEQFRDALEQYRAVINFDGGDLENLYYKLEREYEESKNAAELIATRIEKVEDVAEDLFEEWEREIAEIGNARLRSDSQQKLRATKTRYRDMREAMWRAEKSVRPVLASLKDQVLYLKHNLNAQAISSLKSELSTVNQNVGELIQKMQRSIDEANQFIEKMN